jgi:hypothetical protein
VELEGSSGERAVVLWSHARDLLRTFRPQAWVVLQDLVFDAEWRDGRLVAPSSARLVAEHLHIDPGTAAAALRTLRERGIAELTQSSGVDGRFGLAAYTLRLPPGLVLLTPRANQPRSAPPRTEIAHRVDPIRNQPCLETAHTATSCPVESTSDRPTVRRRRRTERSGEWSQGVLDLGTGNS